MKNCSWVLLYSFGNHPLNVFSCAAMRAFPASKSAFIAMYGFHKFRSLRNLAVQIGTLIYCYYYYFSLKMAGSYVLKIALYPGKLTNSLPL